MDLWIYALLHDFNMMLLYFATSIIRVLIKSMTHMMILPSQ